MKPELHRPFAIDAVPPGGAEVQVEANAAEAAALAGRMGVPAISSLLCRFRLVPAGRGAIAAEGQLHATVVQTCVVTLEDFPATVQEGFAVRFVPLGTESDDPDPESEDEIPYTGGVIDLGEAAAEQLALALDPYPRAPGAALPDQAEIDGAAPTPFAGLAALRRRQ
jgi:hypothetical protein